MFDKNWRIAKGKSIKIVSLNLNEMMRNRYNYVSVLWFRGQYGD